jgi:TnsA endonuclease N terminal
MARFAKSLYNIINKEKYIGKKIPICRSSWESAVCLFFDNHPGVISWASEPFQIQYKDPLTNKTRNYIPDFFVIYQDKDDVKHAEVIEVKPSSQTGQRKTKSLVEQAMIVKNQAKWSSAMSWCAKQGYTFRLLTEQNIFSKGKK